MRVGHLVALPLVLLVPRGAIVAQDAQHGQHDREGQHASAVGIGAVSFANSGNATAQEPFQRGVALLHSFAYRPAARAFEEAERADPGLAVAYWAEALTYSHPLWGQEDTSAAHEALRRLAPSPAERLSRAQTPRERAFGAAVEAYYQDAALPVRAHAFADSMRAFTSRYPADLEGTAFAALAVLLDANLGGLQGAQRDAAQEEAIALAERVFRASPHHPGGAHYLIHATDDPKLAARGLAAARAYARIAPSVEHALHMPSHIFVQTGLWPDLVASNERAWAASRANAADEHLSAAALDFHSLAWLTYGYLEQGRFRAARATVDTADAVLRGVALPRGNPDPAYARSWQSFQYAMETDDWSAYRPSWRESTPDTSSTRALTMTLGSAYQHAVAAAMLGDTSSASAAWLRGYAAAHPDVGRRSGVLRRGILHLDAIAARRRGDIASELAILERAAAADDSAGALIGPPAILRSQELLGAALLRAGRPADAARAYERALVQAPNRSAALLGLARARTANGDAAAARDAYRALATNWSSGDADFPAVMEARRASNSLGVARSPHVWTEGEIISAAVLPLPVELREGAGVLRRNPDGAMEMRPSRNGFLCFAPVPADTVFDARCYQVPFARAIQRARALGRTGISSDSVTARMNAAVRAGDILLPESPSAGYRMMGPMSAYDPVSGRAGRAIAAWQSLHVPFRTASELGMSETQHGAEPFVMASGTWWSHVMIVHDSVGARAP